MTAADLCAASAVLYASLTGTYHEARVVTLVQDQSVIEIWASDDTETWTALKTTADGQSCILGAGTGVVPALAVKGDPA